MTRYDPSIIVNRMMIERNGNSVYDERFHKGINIIRGENSSGKSTILNFLFYGLGGDLTDWSDVALRCSTVIIEVKFNNKIATLSREISQKTGQPMDIFGGDLASAIIAPRGEWVRYPYKRSQSKESFSQALFRLLEMPEVVSELSGNVTNYQVLRLLYADQLSPVESIFKFEGFDPPPLREAVGRLLCGAYDGQLYENELLIRELNKKFDSVSAELRSLFSVLGQSEEGLTLEWIAGQRLVLTERRESLRKEIADAELRLFASEAKDKITLRAQENAYSEVQQLQEDILLLREKVDGISFAIADSDSFISSITRKIHALNDVNAVAEYIVEVQFGSCPACFAIIESDDATDFCHLCKTPFDSERARSRIVSLINDTALQLKQSLSLQDLRKIDLDNSIKKLRNLEEVWRAKSEYLTTVRALPSGDLQDALRELYRKSGYLDREIEDLEIKASIVQLVDKLSKQKAELNFEISRIRTENEGRNSAQKRRLAHAYTLIADEVRKLLHHDLRRQDTFENAQSIEFDFGANRITVDGESYFSASSRVILKSSFIVGFLSASIKDSSFRYPRFCIIDTIEDKGMEPIRSHNFQMQIAEISSKSEVDHQTIFATAMIAPDLDNDSFTVGKYSTRDNPTLVISD
jgi:hypothetical protein